MALTELIAYDRSHADIVCGVDEAGRGCFAGPLVAAAVRLDYRKLTAEQILALARLNDSKKLSEAARERLYPTVLASAQAVSVCSRSARSIDERGLHVCNLDANHAALTRVVTPEAMLLADGFALASIAGRQPLKVIGGDRTSAAIAAASIIAKVVRDRLMHRLALIYPQYGFERHAGYGTRQHQQAIRALGLTPQHRHSFKGLVALGASAPS